MKEVLLRHYWKIIKLKEKGCIKTKRPASILQMQNSLWNRTHHNPRGNFQFYTHTFTSVSSNLVLCDFLWGIGLFFFISFLGAALFIPINPIIIKFLKGPQCNFTGAQWVDFSQTSANLIGGTLNWSIIEKKVVPLAKRFILGHFKLR